MTDRVHGGIRGGEFLTGKMDFFSVETELLMDQTGVDTPVADLYQISSTVWTPVTVVDGRGVANTYATSADYVTAWKKQQNLNIMMNVFGNRANPVIISVSDRGVVNIATEKSGLWYVDDGVGNYGAPALDTNYTGYKVETELEVVKFWDAMDTTVPTADMTFGGGGNTAISRRIVL